MIHELKNLNDNYEGILRCFGLRDLITHFAAMSDNRPNTDCSNEETTDAAFWKGEFEERSS